MTAPELWPWLALVGLGLFHGVNPAMGWLFAVALGLHRGSQNVVLLSLLPIALGHAVSVALVVAAVLALGLAIDHTILTRLAAVALIGWALWHAVYGHRQRVRVGMTTGLLGLTLWSFLMASAHGAGLMLIPVLIPLCLAAAPAQELSTTGSTGVALAALAVHTATMLATIAVIALVVYRWIGVAFLRRGWINLDLVWVAALVLCGVVLLVV
ncbi:MAG: hypothetical protein ACJ8FV_15155 [Xanthobacteraceae bacterium]